jgi:hypothetical protein
MYRQKVIHITFYKIGLLSYYMKAKLAFEQGEAGGI